ncbi:2-phospho-L-lactate guanylyltransferase [Candidatus Nitrososphaera evergladensis SR1]|uniref:2-phospho-L-lactate guanylyltransferase n=1 Tax=Candidatus Nitrososphaera evergladensis SR1 TaxID=1459636 RepID=A0A075MQP0_9ARCH|nr:2-phospho-L-lactate guanylyltransferase [Candidatus Nitrososphaera evergladensis]AIF83528.1 2-phospho-L-lactate guanylyltransferase [Candidatus Nitrososphaera evergladensis SR1]
MTTTKTKTTIIAIIPVKKFENSKSRLSAVLSVQDRVRLAGLMLQDTLATLDRCKLLAEIVVVSSDERAGEIARKYGATVLFQAQDAGVNSAVAVADRYAVQKKNAGATIVIPQDLPLLGAGDVDGICSAAAGRCIVICPSLRYDGTNLLLRMPADVISTSYDNNSYESHIVSARAQHAAVRVIEQEHLMFDIDTQEDARQLAQMDPRLVVAKNVALFLKEKALLSSF